MHKRYGIIIEQLNHTLILQSDSNDLPYKIDFKNEKTAKEWYIATCTTLNAHLKKSCYTKLYANRLETGSGYIFDNTDIFIEKQGRNWHLASAKIGVVFGYDTYPTRKKLYMKD